MTQTPILLALTGIGKIARDQHIPTLAASDDFELVAAISRNATVDGAENFPALASALEALPEIAAVSLATPPGPRFAQAREALLAGRHVMLEKPPGATLAEVMALQALAARKGLSLYASWHSRAAAGVATAKEWLARRSIIRVEVNWLENIRQWHPGQDWILAPGGMGVFDPGINALSILTEILPEAFALKSGLLHVPENRQGPMRAELEFGFVSGAPMKAVFDFLHAGEPCWDIHVETGDGRLSLSKGGAELAIAGEAVEVPENAEYAGLYARFAELIRAGESDVDVMPFVHVADAMTLCERIAVEAFEW